MPTPTKPYAVIQMEGKSHRTKRELEQRKQAEERLLSGKELKERPEVKNNSIAHKEFLRISGLLKKMEKNDAIYEAVINRFCMLQAECRELEERREQLYQLIFDLRNTFDEASSNMDPNDHAGMLLAFTKEMAKISNTMLGCDKQIQAKRKMLLDIEKENIMTIASALRSIPKKNKEEEEEDPMTVLLRQRQRVQ